MAKTKTPLKLKVRIPHVILDVRDADPALLENLLPGLDEVPARFRVLGNGLKTVSHVFSLEEALEEGHIWVVLGKHLPREFPLIIERGIVPVMQSGLHPGAENYNPVEESGNAFLFPKASAWNVHAALIRSLENFAFHYDWENLRTQGKALMKI